MSGHLHLLYTKKCDNCKTGIYTKLSREYHHYSKFSDIHMDLSISSENSGWRKVFKNNKEKLIDLCPECVVKFNNKEKN